MRTTSFVSVLAALVSIASIVPTGFGAHEGRVAARDPARVRSPPVTPPNLARNVPRAAPSPRQDRRDYAPRAEPSSRHDRRRDHLAPRAEPSPRHVPRHEKRSQEEQNLFGNKIEEGQGWGLEEDQCPAPLSACPVRGARDADAFECVDLWSDLSSCGGCAADDTACVWFLFFKTPKSLIARPMCSSYDCNVIPHARSVECLSGSCKVRACAEGYVPREGYGCVRVIAQ